MNSRPSLAAYLVRDSLMRWGGRLSSPLARLLVATALSTTALLVLASVALGVAALQERIAAFGLDALVVRTPMPNVSAPAPVYPALTDLGRVLTLKVPHAIAGVDLGGNTSLAVAEDRTLEELAGMGVQSDQLPVLISATLPPGLPVRAGLGPWWVGATTVAPSAALRPLGLPSLLVIRAGDFPMQSRIPGTALTLFVRAPTARPLGEIVAALETVIAANPVGRESTPTVQSALPLLAEMTALQSTWRHYAALLAAVLAATIAAVFGSGAVLEYEATAYTTALLRSFGVSRLTLWLQRYAEAALLANAGGLLALAAAAAIARIALPQLLPHLGNPASLGPVWVALNLGALVAALPVAIALRRPVGMVLQ